MVLGVRGGRGERGCGAAGKRLRSSRGSINAGNPITITRTIIRISYPILISKWKKDKILMKPASVMIRVSATIYQ